MAIDLFCSLLFNLSITEILMCKVNAHFPGPIILANCFQFNGENYWREMSKNMCKYFAQLYLGNG